MENHAHQKRFNRDQYASDRPRSESGAHRRMPVSGIQAGQEFEVAIEQIGHKGDGMVKVEGYTVFVKNVEQGEQVRIKIYKVLDNIAFGERLGTDSINKLP